MGKFAKAQFRPKHPEKYVGKYPIMFRSSWEFAVMRAFDVHPSVLTWESESRSIPYCNPLTGRWTMYVPDFVVTYVGKAGRKVCDMLEVKPIDENPFAKGKGRLTERDKLVNIINYAKWTAAMVFCAKRGWNFRVVGDEELFAFTRRKR